MGRLVKLRECIDQYRSSKVAIFTPTLDRNRTDSLWKNYSTFKNDWNLREQHFKLTLLNAPYERYHFRFMLKRVFHHGNMKRAHIIDTWSFNILNRGSKKSTVHYVILNGQLMPRFCSDKCLNELDLMPKLQCENVGILESPPLPGCRSRDSRNLALY